MRKRKEIGGTAENCIFPYFGRCDGSRTAFLVLSDEAAYPDIPPNTEGDLPSNGGIRGGGGLCGMRKATDLTVDRLLTYHLCR